MKSGKRILKVIRIATGIVLLLFGILIIFIRKPSVQTWLVHKTASYLSDKLNTKVSVGSIDIAFYKTVTLKNIYIEDRKQDTLLYANQLNVSIGIFNLLRSKFSIDKIELNNAAFNMLRGQDDSDFNYQFILDALGSADTSQSGSSPPDLNVKAIRLNNIRFHFRDEPATDLSVYLPSAQIDFNKLSLENPTLDVKNIFLNQPDIRVISLYDTTASVDRSNDTGVIHLNTGTFQLLVKKFRITNARFRFDDENVMPDTTRFDTYHMDFANANLFFDNVRFTGDSIVGKIAQISCKEKSGLQVDTLYGDARVTPFISELNNLYIKTPNSRLRDYFSFNYNRFPDFNYFLTKVIMKGDFRNSIVSVNDLSVFAPELIGNNQSLNFRGRILGTVDNLKARQLDISAGKVSFLRGNISFRGLPDVNETFVDLDLDEARSCYSDLRIILPKIQFPENLDKLGMMNVTGNFSGFFKDFVAYAVLSTDIGVVNSDLNMKIKKGLRMEYAGSLSSSGFNLGKFIGQDSLLGKISMVSKVRGSRLGADDFNSNILAHVDRFDFNGYSYSGISVDGFFDNKLFTGKLLVLDNSLKLNFQGTVNFNDSLPKFNFFATIDSARLRRLNFSEEDYLLSTELNIHIQGDNIDEMQGNAKAVHTVFRKERQIFRLDSLSVNSFIKGNQKTFLVRSDILSLLLQGRFNIGALPQAFIAVLSHYFPSLPVSHELPAGIQDLDYSVTVRNTDAFMNFFFPEYSGLSNSTLNGHFNTQSNSLSFNCFIPEFGKSEILGRKIIINGETDETQISLNLTSGYFQLNDSIKVIDPFFSVQVINDTALVNLKAHDVTSNYLLDVIAKVTGRENFISMKFLPSLLTLNKNEWHFAPNNEIVYEKNSLRATNFRLIQDNQSVSLSNLPADEGVTNLRLSMKNLHLEDFYNLFQIKDVELKGSIDGNADMLNVFGSPRFDVHTTVTDFHINNDSISKIYTDINYNTMLDKMDAVVKVKDNRYDIEVRGNYIPGKKDDTLDFKADIIKAELPIIDNYVGDIVTGTEGKVAGQVFLKGTLKKPQLTGSLIIPYAKTTVDYLQTTYNLNGVKVELKNNLIDLGEFTLYDTDGNTAKAGGKITHDNLKNFKLDLYANTNNFQLLKTTPKDNSLFYGTAYGSGIVKFTGTIDNLDISASLQSKAGTAVSIPITDETSVTEKNFIRFVNVPGDTLKKTTITETTPDNLSINLELDITPDAQVRIIFDQKAGDIISGNGSGHLRMEINPAGDFNLYGTYTVEQGDYLFTLQNFFSKKFSIEKGGTISWSGDPYQAKINLNAIYKVTKTSLSDLTEGTGIRLSEADQREAEKKVPVNVYMNLSGSLLSPNIVFDIKIPESGGSISSYATRKLDEIKQDENELNKQVFGLLMLNRFLPPTFDPGIVTTSATSVGEFVANQLSYWLSQGFNKYGLDINVTTAEYGSSLTNPTDPSQTDIRRKELQVALTKRFFNNRVSVDVGSNFDYGQNVTNNKQQNNIYLGDFTVEYKLTQDGRLSLKGFYRSNYDIIDERNRNKYGGSISFKKDFNKFSDIFRSQELKKKNN